MLNSNQNTSHRAFYTVKEVSVLFNISTKSVYRLLARGHLKASSALRHKRISKASIDQFIVTTFEGGAQ